MGRQQRGTIMAPGSTCIEAATQLNAMDDSLGHKHYPLRLLFSAQVTKEWKLGGVVATGRNPALLIAVRPALLFSLPHTVMERAPVGRVLGD